eukprot:1649221-Pleurochrysis_carterae.AAC.1
MHLKPQVLSGEEVSDVTFSADAGVRALRACFGVRVSRGDVSGAHLGVHGRSRQGDAQRWRSVCGLRR